MESFKEFLERINERLLFVGHDRRSKMEPYNNIIILAGGAGSGKDFALNNFIGFEGKIFNVDDTKSKVIELVSRGGLKDLQDRFTKKTGLYIQSLNLSNPSDVQIFHKFLKDEKIDDKMIEIFMQANAKSKHKPNVCFNVTLKDLDKLTDISEFVQMAGYKKENIHIVWVVNDFNVALKQNAQRSRSVSSEIMFKTHNGVVLTLKDILNDSEKYRKYADGEIWIMANQANVDSFVDIYPKKYNPMFNRMDNQRTIVLKYTASLVKKKGKPSLTIDELYKDITHEIMVKVKEYIPNGEIWN